MGTSNSSMSIVGIIALVILVGVAVYFMIERNDSAIDIDIGLMLEEPAGPPAGPTVV